MNPLNHTQRVLITTIPFGKVNPRPIELLEKTPNVEYVINPIGRKLKAFELRELIEDFDIVIAGTEPITSEVLDNGKRLKLISRVGIGLDSVDLLKARELGITVCYTPDAPAPAVAELTIGHMLNLLRYIPLVDRKLRSGIWQRYTGKLLSNQVVGIRGVGRVGSRVLKHLQGFNPAKILVHDIKPNHDLYHRYNAKLVDEETLFRESDILTLHVPLTKQTKSMVTERELRMMKRNSYLINTSRGGIVDEHDLYHALKEKIIAGAAIDVFEEEPYSGSLTELENCFFSCHMGSMTEDCRARMEIEATEEALRFIKGEDLQQIVPEEEYSNRL